MDDKDDISKKNGFFYHVEDIRNKYSRFDWTHLKDFRKIWLCHLEILLLRIFTILFVNNSKKKKIIDKYARQMKKNNA